MRWALWGGSAPRVHSGAVGERSVNHSGARMAPASHPNLRNRGENGLYVPRLNGPHMLVLAPHLTSRARSWAGPAHAHRTHMLTYASPKLLYRKLQQRRVTQQRVAVRGRLTSTDSRASYALGCLLRSTKWRMVGLVDKASRNCEKVAAVSTQEATGVEAGGLWRSASVKRMRTSRVGSSMAPEVRSGVRARAPSVICSDVCQS